MEWMAVPLTILAFGVCIFAMTGTPLIKITKNYYNGKKEN